MLILIYYEFLFFDCIDLLYYRKSYENVRCILFGYFFHPVVWDSLYNIHTHTVKERRVDVIPIFFSKPKCEANNIILYIILDWISNNRKYSLLSLLFLIKRYYFHCQIYVLWFRFYSHNFTIVCVRWVRSHNQTRNATHWLGTQNNNQYRVWTQNLFSSPPFHCTELMNHEWTPEQHTL